MTKNFEFFKKEPNGNGYYLKVNWGTMLTIILSLTIALAGGAWHFTTAAQSELNKKIDANVNVTHQNCRDIAVLKEIANTTKETLKKMDGTIEEIRRDQVKFYQSLRSIRKEGKSE